MKVGNYVFFALMTYALYWVVRNRGLFIMFRAMRNYSKGEIERSLALIERALSLYLKADHRLTLGYILLKEGHIEEAKEVIAPLRDVDKKRFDKRQAVVYYSLVLWKGGHVEAAADSLEELLKEGFENSILYNNLGFYLIEKGDYKRALEVNLAGLEFNNISQVIRDNLVLNYIKLGQWEEALEFSAPLISELPKFPDAYYNRALIHIHNQEWEEARDLLLRAEGKNFSYLSTITKEKIIETRNALGEK